MFGLDDEIYFSASQLQMRPLLSEAADPGASSEEQGQGELFADLYCLATLWKFSLELREKEPIIQGLLSLRRFVFSILGNVLELRTTHHL